MKTSILGVLAICALLFATVAEEPAAPNAGATAEKKPDPKALNGAYEMKLDNGGVRKRLMVDGRWEITQSDPKTGQVIFHHGGAYVFDGRNYVETVDYAGESTLNMVGLVHKFVVTINENSVKIQGTDNPWNEEWVRVPAEFAKTAIDLENPPAVPGGGEFTDKQKGKPSPYGPAKEK